MIRVSINYLLIKWKDPQFCRGIDLLEAFSDENNRINQTSL